MRKNLNNDYNNLKKNYYRINKNSNQYRFFSGLNNFLSIGLYQSKTKKKNYPMIYRLKYAIIIFVVGMLLVLSVSPVMHRVYIEKKYKQMLFNELTFSYNDTIDASYEEQEYFINEYLYIDVDGVF